MFNWKWYLSELPEPDDINVFSCFACGGGSSMGYKRAGFNVLGNVEIDPKINAVYNKNLKPKYSFTMDIRDFLKEDLPKELYELDVLDGSPPCSSFSTAGVRERDWAKEKRFAEGQKLQTLDDLFFVFLDVVEKLRPKIVVAENVTGITIGNAKYYVTQIIKRFKGLGYELQIFRLNSKYMNVPQSRERIFFIANRMNLPKLKLNFNADPITFGEVRSKTGLAFTRGAKGAELLKKRCAADKNLRDIAKRLGNSCGGFNANRIVKDFDVCPTVCASGGHYRMCDGLKLSSEDLRNVSSFPQDYDFSGASPVFICGMSVPPNMMANIAYQIKKQWIDFITN